MENEYLSDDEKEDTNEVEELTFEEMYPDEEIDEETLALIYNNNNNNNIDEFNIIKEKKKKDKKKSKEITVISLEDLSKKFEEKKIEKWSSQRIESKRVDSKKEEIKKEIRYKFNPRLPPFNSIHKEYNNDKKILNVNDKNLFPSL